MTGGTEQMVRAVFAGTVGKADRATRMLRNCARPPFALEYLPTGRRTRGRQQLR